MISHSTRLQQIYQECFGTVEEESPLRHILVQAGKAYAHVHRLNVEYAYVQEDSFDHTAVYFMAEWIKANVRSRILENVTAGELAKRVTDQILEYYDLLQHESKKTRFEDETTDISILFLTADPSDQSRLRLGRESREIGEKLKLARLSRRFFVHQRHAVRAEDVSLALLDYKPALVHFSGHGTSDGAICFEDHSGMTQFASPDALAALFRLVSKNVYVVLLNACYSELQARAIAEHIDYVIGMNSLVSDHAAIAFAIGFYQALGTGLSVERAFEFGCVQIMLQGIPEHSTPVLIAKRQSV